MTQHKVDIPIHLRLMNWQRIISNALLDFALGWLIANTNGALQVLVILFTLTVGFFAPVNLFTRTVALLAAGKHGEAEMKRLYPYDWRLALCDFNSVICAFAGTWIIGPYGLVLLACSTTVVAYLVNPPKKLERT